MSENLNLKTIETIDTSPFKHLCVTIGALPSSFVESMSYYECLAWLVSYIENTVIPAVNNNGEACAELQTAFIELKTFVDDYFENLDVQEEINNKLDDMAEQGTLQEIITTYIQANVAWTFDTVADMKLATNLVNGSYARTLGFYSKDDFGGGLYKIRELNIGETADEAFVISVENSLVAELIPDKTLYSKQIGLKGDNSTDQTALLNTFFAKNINCNKVINSGEYVISDTIYIKGVWDAHDTKNQQRIIFDNASLKYTGTVNGYSVILFNHRRGLIDGLTIDTGSNINYTGIIGCWETKFENFSIRGLKISNDSSALTSQTFETPSIQNITLSHCHILGKTYIDADDNSYINGVYFNECILSGSNLSASSSDYDDYLITLGGTKTKEQLNFKNCDLSYAKNAIFNVLVNQVGIYADSLGKGNVDLDGCYFDSSVPIVDDNKNMTFTLKNCKMDGNANQMSVSKLYSDFLKNTQINSADVVPDYLPTGNVNLAINGDFSTNGTYGQTSSIIGIDGDTTTKTWETSTRNRFGRCRKIILTGNMTFRINMVKCPTEGVYCMGVRFMVTSGTAQIRTIFGLNGEAGTWFDIPLNKEMMLTQCKGMFINQVGEDPQPKLSVFGGTAQNPVTIEFYELICCPGRMILPNMPLHSGAHLDPVE